MDKLTPSKTEITQSLQTEKNAAKADNTHVFGNSTKITWKF